MNTPRRTARASGAAARQRDPDRTQNEILEVATREFAERGYSGGRVDEIAAQTRTTKRMIYYYFGGKEGLFIAVLQRAYARIRALEQQVDVNHLDPASAIRRVAELTFDHHESHPDFIRLVSIENTHRAEHLAKLDGVATLNNPAVTVLEEILSRGYDTGVFHRQVEPLDLHMLISSFCVFRVANRYTFRSIFGRDMMSKRLRQRYRKMVGDMAVSYLTTE